MPLPKGQICTIEDIYDLPAGQRAELIDGQIYDMAPPTRKHQKILLSISRKIASYIDSSNGSCEVDIAPFAVFLDEDDYNYVDPDKNRIMIYDFAGDETAEYTFSDMVPVGIYPDFSIDFSTIRL